MNETVSTHRGAGAVAVTPHHDATRAAVAIMEAGGSAADAVIAANAVLGMVLPTTCGIGGDLFAIIHEPGWDRPQVLNASGRGGSGLDAELLRSRGLTQMPPYGPESVSVPGCVDGWMALQDRHGALGLDAILDHAIVLGEEGFDVSLELAEALDRLAPSLMGQPSADALYPDGAPPERGHRLRRSDLAATLRHIAITGRDAFYSGAVAEAVSRATDGILTKSDLEQNRPDWVEPLGLDVFGHTGWTIPPNSQGYLTLATCWAFAQLDPPNDPADPRYHHALIEAYRAFAFERNDVVADPDRLPWALDRYLDTTRLADRTATIDPSSVTPRPVPTPGPPGTAYFCAVDRQGQAVSCIQSNYFGIGSRISAGDTGIFLHNRGAGFSLQPGHPNEAAPGYRPLHTLSPTLWTNGDTTSLVLGTRGGDQQPQYLAQMAASLLHLGSTPAEAQRAPRWSMTASDASPGSVVSVETGMPEEVVTGLGSFGHTVVAGPPRTPGWGPVSAIALDGSGSRTAAADPRVTTASAAGD